MRGPLFNDLRIDTEKVYNISDILNDLCDTHNNLCVDKIIYMAKRLNRYNESAPYIPNDIRTIKVVDNLISFTSNKPMVELAILIARLYPGTCITYKCSGNIVYVIHCDLYYDAIEDNSNIAPQYTLTVYDMYNDFVAYTIED